jgi:hypothetical protein
VTVVYVVFVVLTMCSVQEVPLSELSIQSSSRREGVGKYRKFNNEESDEEDLNIPAGYEHSF